MLSIAVCDNEKSICIHIEKLLDKFSAELGEEIEVCTFTNGETFYQTLFTGSHFDLILLDIDLGTSINGLEICRKMREEGFVDKLLPVILISGKEGYEKELIQLYPLYFLSKPFDYTSFSEMMTTALKVECSRQQVFEFAVGYEKKRIPMNRILYFESDKRKVNVVSIDTKDSFYGSLKDVEEHLKGSTFLRIHESYLVNTNFIESFRFENVILLNKEPLPISQSRQKGIRLALLELYRG